MKYCQLISILFLSFMAQAQQPSLTSATLGKMEARAIGPAVMGGRITSIEGCNKEPRIVYVGTAGGGIWKSVNGGASFKAVFDKHCQSIGALAVDQQNPDIIWAGTGESNMRNSVSIGNGIYKSIDGGENWVNMGLENTEHISKVIVHPTNSQIIFVAAPGKLWSDSKDRGLFKSIDGGKTWKNMLNNYINERTGCADVVINPKNPDIIYASTWEFRRKPFAFESGGKLSTILKSTDGGQNWKKVTNGILGDTLGRIALALSPSAPENLVAIVEGKKTKLYLSTNGAENWKEQSGDNNVTARPFYFSCIQFDPKNEKKVYRPAFQFSYSEDGGFTWAYAQNSSGWVHVDMHALWINPQNPSNMYLGTDGGVYTSLDAGNNWIFLNSIPVSQLYHLQVDQQEPYNVYCGLQDNGSWTAPSQSAGGIKNGDWQSVGWGDGFWVQPDRNDNKIVYSEYQGGNAQRLDRRTNQGQDVQPKPAVGEEKLRFNWNTPIYFSPTNAKRLYMGSQFLHISENGGISWKRSIDLTTNDSLKKKQEESGGLTADNTSAENHCTIFTIAESPLEEKTVLVGTDDGNFQISNDAGNTWHNVSKSIAASGIPSQTWVSSIEPSHFDKQLIYVTFDNHTYGDMNTYLAVSKDGGNSWKQIKSPVFKGYAHKIKEDIENRNLLFLGTEWGLYLSIDAGENWTLFNAKIPEYVAVRDIVIEPKTADLVLATHGRGILIVDDISPLRKINNTLLNSEAVFISSRPAPLTTGHYYGGAPTAGGFVGANSTEEATIIYYLKKRVNSGNVKVEIYDNSGKLLAEKTCTKRKGINKITWDMRSLPPKVAEGGAKIDWAGTTGLLVNIGTYQMKLKIGDLEVAQGKLELIADPKNSFSKSDMESQRNSVSEVFTMHENLANTMKDLLTEQKPLKEKMKEKDFDKVIKEYNDSLENIRATIVAVKEGTAITGEEKIREKLSDLYWGLNFYQGKPTDSQTERIKGLQKEITDVKKRLDTHKANYKPKVEKAMKVQKQNPY